MILEQLSVFIENKSGRLNEVFEILGKSGIRIIAASVADTSEYGILRLITTDTLAAYTQLKENNVSANLSEVVAITCDSEATTFAVQLKYFAQAGVDIEYMYCFSIKEKATLILRTKENEKALAIIQKMGLKSLTQEELSTM